MTSVYRKDKENNVFFGVCSGFAKTYGWDVLWLRAGLVGLTLLGFGFPILAYIVIAMLSN
jgi:phage shock protein C